MDPIPAYNIPSEGQTSMSEVWVHPIRRSSTLVGRSLADTDVYICQTCFIKSPDAELPKAYKDCTTIRELNKRVEQLTGVRPKVELNISDDEAERGSREP
jgi:hypothetical protein